jgi:phosphate uptake regulator
MISLRNVMKKMDWNGKSVELGKVYSNPYVNAFNSMNEGEESTPEETLAGLKDMAMGDLERIADYANMIAQRMREGQDLDSWMYSQLTTAVDNLNAVRDAMDGNDGVIEPPKK